MTYDGVDIGEAIQPIQDRVETFQSNGYAVVSPGDALSAGAYAVTVNSGDLNAGDTLSVGSSNDEILFDGSTKNLSSATNITINGISAAGDGTEQYRYDVIYADSSGEVKKTEGSVTKLDSRESQNNLTRFERFKAAIPNPGTDPSVIIAAVIVNSNDTSVSTSQLRDYRVPATTTADTVDANTVDATTTNTANLDGGVTGNTTVSDIIGSGIEVVSGSLQAALGDGLDFASGNIQILDSIWDAAHTELTADVNNTNTTTDTLEADESVTFGLKTTAPDNAPITGSGASLTASFNQSYPAGRIIIEATDQSGSDSAIAIQVNGITSGYETVDQTGTTDTKTDSGRLGYVSPGSTSYTVINFDNFGDGLTFSPAATGNVTNISAGVATPASTPNQINSLTAIRKNGNATDWKITVEGVLFS